MPAPYVQLVPGSNARGTLLMESYHCYVRKANPSLLCCQGSLPVLNPEWCFLAQLLGSTLQLIRASNHILHRSGGTKAAFKSLSPAKHVDGVYIEILPQGYLVLPRLGGRNPACVYSTIKHRESGQFWKDSRHIIVKPDQALFYRL